MLDALLNGILDGRAGAAVVLAVAWFLEYRRSREKDREYIGSMKSVEEALKNINVSMALMLDRERR